MDGSVAEHYPIPYVHATDNEVTFLTDLPGSSVSAKRGAVSVFKNSSRLAVKPSPWLLTHGGYLMLDETSGVDAGAVMRRPGIKSLFFGTVKRSFAPRHTSPTSPWVSRSCTSLYSVAFHFLGAMLSVIRSRCPFIPQYLQFALNVNFDTFPV